MNLNASTAALNKAALQTAFAVLAEGDGAPFVALMDDDFCWHMIGTTAWSGSYRGKQVVRERLFAPLFAQFADRYSNSAERFIAEGDYVVVQAGDA